MPILHVTLLKGRSRTRSEELIRALTDAAERTLAVPRTSVRVIFQEVPPEHWGIGGETVHAGKAASVPKKRERRTP